MFRVGLVACDFGDSNAILLAGTDADGRAVFDVKYGVGGYARFDEPSENEILVFLGRGKPVYLMLLESDFTSFLVG